MIKKQGEFLCFLKRKTRKYFFFFSFLNVVSYFLTLTLHIFWHISMKIKIWNQSLVSDFPLLFPPQVMVGLRKTFLTSTYIVLWVLVGGLFLFCFGFFLVIALFSQRWIFSFFSEPYQENSRFS